MCYQNLTKQLSYVLDIPLRFDLRSKKYRMENTAVLTLPPAVRSLNPAALSSSVVLQPLLQDSL